MRGILRPSGLALTESGHSDAVARQRGQLHHAVRKEFVATIEELLDTRVLAFMSGMATEPDVTVLVFLLDNKAEAVAEAEAD